MFDQPDQHQLLLIARRALEARVRRAPEPSPDGGGALDIPCGAFVSIHAGRELRGCLGRLQADLPVSIVVAHLGSAVADSDPRFAPVTTDELAHLSVEVSILHPARVLRSPDEIEIGRHGLIVERGDRRGLLLPQVATEHEWDVDTFLQRTCVKAGLSPDAWNDGTRVLLFEAQVFADVRTLPRP